MPSLVSVVVLSTVIAASYAPNAPTPRPNHPILGSWKFVVPGSNGCFEIYTFRPNGTRGFSSAQEEGEATYTISAQPSEHGYYMLTDTVTRDNEKPDCSGSVTPVGDNVTLFVRFNPQSADEFIICGEESLAACFGPFVRLKDNAT